MHKSCDTLPLSVFIDCMCDNDYTGMGGAGKEENEMLWRNCFEEYVYLVNRGDASYSMILSIEIEQLTMRHFSIDRAIELLHQVRDNDIVNMLQEEGIRLKFNDKDRPSYFNDLRRAKKFADRLMFDIDNKRAMLDQMQGGRDSNKINRQWFNDNIAAVNKWLKFPIHRERTTVAMYASYLSMINESVNAQKVKQDG